MELALWITGILMTISAVYTILTGFVNDNKSSHKIGWIISGIGCLIAAFLFSGYGRTVRSSEITDKFTIATKFVYVVGLMSSITGVFVAISCVGFDDKSTCLAAETIIAIFSLIIIAIYKAITNNKVDTFDRIIWIVLVTIFALDLIVSILTLTSLGSNWTLVANLIKAICNIITYLFILVYMLDKNVKAKFGM